ncbi:MAG: respiratory nitrate reductase subunit gamma [Candidatus Latescibacterota bacterium]|nr:MAG: respiratory nitrate reductase subunit gamma [Candidatus Latescibacterota bacterium]
MDTQAFFIMGVLPYMAVTVFVVGMIFRLRDWAKTPQPGKMTLFPAGDSTKKSVLSETFLFPSLFKGDKVLWSFAWLFHAMLALVFVGHIRVFTGLIDRMLMGAGMTPAHISTMSATLGGGAGIVLLATGLLLLFRRITQERVREISNIGDFFALLLLVAIIFTGDLMRFGSHFELEQTRAWARSLVTFSPIVVNNGMFQVHLLLAMLLIIYIPFSKIMHFGGIFFTQALIKRR